MMASYVAGQLAFPDVLCERLAIFVEAVTRELDKAYKANDIDDIVELSISFRDEKLTLRLVYPALTGFAPSDDANIGRDEGELSGVDDDTKSFWDKEAKLLDRLNFHSVGKDFVLSGSLYLRDEFNLKKDWVMPLKPKLNSTVRLDVVSANGSDDKIQVLQDVSTGKVVKLDDAGSFIVSRLDGVRRMQDLYFDSIDEIGLKGPDFVTKLYLDLESAGMLELSDNQKKAQIDSSGPLHLKLVTTLTLPQSELIVPQLYQKTKWLLLPLPLLMIAIICMAGIGYIAHLAIKHQNLLVEPALIVYDRPIYILELVVLFLISTIIHESAHAVVCRHYGGAVRRLGVILFPGMAMFFADVTTATLFKQKWRRFAVAVAGPIATLTFMSLCFGVWLVETWLAPSVDHSVWLMGGYLCLVVTVFNILPFGGTDGYYMLADALDMPRLREDARAYFGQFIGGERQEVNPDTFRKRAVLFLYGGLCIIIPTVLVVLPVIEFASVITEEHPDKMEEIFWGGAILAVLLALVIRAYKKLRAQKYRNWTYQ